MRGINISQFVDSTTVITESYNFLSKRSLRSTDLQSYHKYSLAYCAVIAFCAYLTLLLPVSSAPSPYILISFLIFCFWFTLAYKTG